METKLRDDDLPLLFKAADITSLKAQQRFLLINSLNLLMLIVAAITGAFVWKTSGTSSTDWAGVVATIAFVTAILLRRDILENQPEKRWYEGRAAAESVKTLAWRYSVGGEPFRVDTLSAHQADTLFAERLQDMLTDLKGFPLTTPAGGEQISPAMRKLRALPLAERKAVYETDRINDQYNWYTRKAKWNEARAERWHWILLIIEIVGLIAAILKAIGVIDIDLLGLVGTMAAAGTSWFQIKQHSMLARAYALTAQELSAIKVHFYAQATEENWARFMDEAEEAISREHTLWRASRGQR